MKFVIYNRLFFVLLFLIRINSSSAFFNKLVRKLTLTTLVTKFLGFLSFGLLDLEQYLEFDSFYCFENVNFNFQSFVSIFRKDF